MNFSKAASGERKAAIVQQSGVRGERTSITLMLLRLGTRWFGMDVRAIEEVALKGTVTRVPTAPSHILGVTTLRGRLVTVVGLEQLIGGAGLLSRENTATLPRLVIVRDNGYEMAVVAEGILGMADHILHDDPEEERNPDLPDFVREEFEWQGNHIALLDIPLLVARAAKLAGIHTQTEQVEI
jgi:chemotaxis signal transduction protein